MTVQGIGQVKATEYGTDLVQFIGDYCTARGVPLDAVDEASARSQPRPAAGDSSGSIAKQRAKQLFLQGRSIDEVCRALDRARSTTTEYLAELIAEQAISDPTIWVDAEVFARIRAAARQHGLERLKPLFEALEGTVGYDELRIAVACLRNAAPEETAAPTGDVAIGPQER
jgi:ATP-dependent DNA helicase RecQ